MFLSDNFELIWFSFMKNNLPPPKKKKCSKLLIKIGLPFTLASYCAEVTVASMLKFNCNSITSVYWLKGHLRFDGVILLGPILLLPNFCCSRWKISFQRGTVPLLMIVLPWFSKQSVPRYISFSPSWSLPKINSNNYGKSSAVSVCQTFLVSLQRERGHWAVYYTSTQGFIITFCFLFSKQLWEFWLFSL